MVPSADELNQAPSKCFYLCCDTRKHVASAAASNLNPGPQSLRRWKADWANTQCGEDAH